MDHYLATWAHNIQWQDRSVSEMQSDSIVTVED